jgi:DnaK suppressor protein
MIEPQTSKRPMTPEETEEVRQQLLERKRRLWSDIRQNLEKEAGEKHQAVLDILQEHGDKAIEELRETAVIHLVELKVKELESIEAAIRRLENGEYGRCQDCGQWIRPARLKAMPYSVRCLHCQEQAEQIEKVEGG